MKNVCGDPEMDCPICLCDANSGAGEMTACSACHGKVHWSCLKQWWGKGAGCPLCRQCAFANALERLHIDVPRTTGERVWLLRAALVAACISPGFRASVENLD